MGNQTTEMVMMDSDEAAQFRTNISGWVSRNGRFCGDDERAARYDGCTHRKCEDCGKPVERGWLVCKGCIAIRNKAKYDATPKEAWDETGMIYSQQADKYFSDWDEVDCFLEDEGGTMEELRLVICEPNYLPLLDKDDYGIDSLIEDGELPDKVIEAIKVFNEVIKNTGPVSWSPGKKAVLLPDTK